MSKIGPAAFPAERIERAILIVRGQRVLLDRELALLYGVETRSLIQAVKRNVDRFPADFMFQLSHSEAQALRSQSVILNAQGPETIGQTQVTPAGRGRNIKYLPYVFTEQGVAMLSSVLRSSRAVHVNIEIMRAFVRLRQLLQQSAELAKQLAALERKYDAQFRVVFDAIRELMAPPTNLKRRIGFLKSNE